MNSAVAVLALVAIFQTAPARVEVTPERSDIEVQGSAQLVARAFDAAGRVIEGAEVRWISTTPEIATVDQTGRVQALNPGMARITAVVAGQPTGSVTVAISPLPAAELSLDAHPGRAFRKRTDDTRGKQGHGGVLSSKLGNLGNPTILAGPRFHFRRVA